MSANVTPNTCRMTVMTSRVRVDLAVPVSIPVSELVATVVGRLGGELADEGAINGGWLLQRAGDAPLDPALTVAACALRDGDVLHLRAGGGRLAEIAFDDVLDAVGHGVAARTPRWQAKYTTRAAVGFAATALTFALLVLLVSGPTWVVPASAATGASALLILTAAGLARALQQRLPALMASAYAIAFGTVAGAMALGRHRDLFEFGTTQLLPAAAAAVLVAVLCLVSTGMGIGGFVAVIAAGVLTAIATGVAAATTLTVPATAGLVAVVTLGVSPFLPLVSFRLARLPLPPIPSTAADLRRDTATIDSGGLLLQTARADQYLTGLVAATAVTLAGAAVTLAPGGFSNVLLGVVLGAILLFRARLFTGRGQRYSLLIGSAVAFLGVLLARSAELSDTNRLLAYAVPAVVVAVVLLAISGTVPARQFPPTVSRAADVLESLLVLSVIPLALGVMGLYGAIRRLSN